MERGIPLYRRVPPLTATIVAVSGDSARVIADLFYLKDVSKVFFKYGVSLENSPTDTHGSL